MDFKKFRDERDKTIPLTVGKEYKCWFSGRIVEFVKWFQEDETPYIRDNYNPLPSSNEEGLRTWCWKYLREATQNDINEYKNDLLNKHQFDNATLIINKDNESRLFLNKDHSSLEITSDTLDQMKQIVDKGYIKKY